MDSARIVKLLLVLGALVGGILAAKAEPPARTRAKLDSQWCFQQGDPAGAEQAGFDDRSWQTVELPHDWVVDQPINEANPRYNGFYPRGIGWYRRHLELDSSWLGRQVYLEFEGVYRDSTLWVNGRKVGSHCSGYTGVVYDLTSCLHFDGQPNLLALRVDGRDGEGWWYEGDGIYRHVRLIATDKIHVANWGTFLTTPRVSTTGTARPCAEQPERWSRGRKGIKESNGGTNRPQPAAARQARGERVCPGAFSNDFSPILSGVLAIGSVQ